VLAKTLAQNGAGDFRRFNINTENASQSISLKAFLETVAAMTSRQDLAESVK
jgi:hypothetical protein